MVETGDPQRDQLYRLISWGHRFTFFNVFCLLIISIGYFFTVPVRLTVLGGLYLVVSWLGHFSFLCFASYLVTLFPLSFMLRRKQPLMIIGSGLASLGMVLLLLDSQIFRLFDVHLNSQVWQALFEQSGWHVALLIGLLGVLIPALFYLEWRLAQRAWQDIQASRNFRLSKRIAMALVVCFVVTHLSSSIADATVYTPITAQRSNYPLSYPMTAKGFLIRHGFLDEAQHAAKAQQTPQRQVLPLYYPQRPLAVDLPLHSPNIAMIVVNGLPNEIPEHMPHLRAFAAAHWRSPDHLSSHFQAQRARFSLLYGLHNTYLPPTAAQTPPALLLDELQRQAYAMGWFAHSTDPMRIKRGLLATWRRQTMVMDVDQPQALLGLARQWIAAQSAPWFSYVQLKDVAAGTTSAAELMQAQVALDSELEALLNDLNAQPNTWVIITSLRSTVLGATATSFRGAAQQQLQVPLIIAAPEGTTPLLVQQSSHVDIAPTLLKHALGVKNAPQDLGNGHDLTQAPASMPWRLVGDRQHLGIYYGSDMLYFNQRGDTQWYRRTTWEPLAHNNAAITLLLAVFDDLNRFYQR